MISVNQQITPPAYLPKAAIAWAEQNRDLLELVVNELLSSGHWPELNQMTRKLAREGKPIALERVVSDMPKPLGFLDHGQDRRIVLLLHGIRMTSSGQALLAGFNAALVVAKDRYAADGDEIPVLRRADITGPDDQAYVDALGEILTREAPFLGGGSGTAAEEWTREITSNIVLFWDVTDAESYLLMRAEELKILPQLGWNSSTLMSVEEAETAWDLATGPVSGVIATEPSIDETSGDYSHDVFVSHASEDKDAVARPLADALGRRGWTAWLDEFELTVGDSLTRRIDEALLKCRFGVVILSPAFFSKEWPQRELAGLAAREIDSGAKVILPVWHGVDRHFVVQHSPVLADRIGAPMSSGIEAVADELALALQKRQADGAGSQPDASAEDVAPEDDDGAALLAIPVTADDQSDLISQKAEWWEYRLYAGVLMQGRISLEGKWRDHQLHLPAGSWRDPPEALPDFLSRKTGAMSQQMETLDRLFEPELLERAFGPPGVAGDPDWIIHIARGIIQTYESMFDWAAELRRTNVAREYAEVLELTARMVDRPLAKIRDFIQLVADQIARIPLHVEEAKAKGATTESPMALDLALHLELDPENQKSLLDTLARMRS